MHGLSTRQADRVQKAGVIIGLEQKLKELNAKETAGLVTNDRIYMLRRLHKQSRN